MKLLNFYGDATQVGLAIATEHGVLEARQLPGWSDWKDAPRSTGDLVSHPASLVKLAALVEQADKTQILDMTKIQFAPCVLNPEKIICIGLNYRQHAIESRMAIPERPVVFSKFSNTLAAHNDSVRLLSNAVQFDYEIELGVVIGKAARNIPPESALDHVFGYCNVNDFSARDLQFQTSQWLLGKTPDGFMPVGPYLVTANEIPDPQALGLKCWFNGELRQNSSTADMIFSVREIISHLSSYMTLKPGDIIATGTPQGVIFGMANPVWVKPGDITRMAIDGLGEIHNDYVQG